MNYADKMEIESRLMNNIAILMVNYGDLLYENQRSNAYTCVRVREVRFRGIKYRIIDIDGMTCQIEKID